ncbi:MAG: DNA gyrase subunit A, partial [Chloroflexi bacterium]|nr:DNA gyrase subunit A [Chloroflexota bacterium]
TIEDLVPHQQMVVLLSTRGYIKRIAGDTYRLQHRGGRGVTGITTREEDAIQHLIVADTHDSMLFFTNRGRVFRLKCYQINQEISRTSRGVPVINLISIEQQEKVTAVIALPNFEDKYLVLATRKGEIKKMALTHFSAVRSNGLRAMDIEPGDDLISAKLGTDEDEIIMVTKNARSIRYPIVQAPLRSRTSGGVRGIRLGPGDIVIGMNIISHQYLTLPADEQKDYVLVVSSNGYGKLTKINNYRIQRRGGSGVRTFRATEKTGPLVASQVVQPNQEIMLISTGGVVIHMLLEDLSVRSRLTRGSSVMKMDKGENVASIACFDGSKPLLKETKEKDKENKETV